MLPATQIKILAVSATLPVLLMASRAAAQCEEAKLTASDAGRDQCFGRSVGISGDVAVAGGAGCWIPGGPGAAYAFRRNGSSWVQQQKLVPSDLQEGSVFGWSVAVSGDTIVVTAPGHSTVNPADGAAFVFRYNGVSWVETQKLFPSDSFMGWHFGLQVAIDADVIAVGQIGEEAAGAPESGAVYVYRWNGTNWQQEQKLVPPDLGPFDNFGASVSVSGNVIVGGAPLNESTDTVGAAYVFRRNTGTWVQEQKLTRAQAYEDGGFASSVAVWGDTLFVGSPENGTPNNYDPGTVLVYRYNGLLWVQTETLSAADGGPLDLFGGSVSLYGNRALVQADGLPDPGTPVGIAYVYEFTGQRWLQRLRLTAPPPPWAKQRV